jgi:hypothetical protein
MGVKVLQGWHSDPFETHGERYFSAAGQPTKLVRDGSRESYDEPPSDPDEVAAAMATLMAKPEAAKAGDWPPGGAYQDDLPVRPDPRDAMPAIVRFTAAGIILAAAAAAAVLVPLTAFSHPSKPGAADVAFVKLAAERTMQQRTAHMVLSGAIAVDGKTFTMHGTDAFDVSGNAGTSDVTVSIPPEGVMTERTIQVNKTAYVSVIVSGQNFMPKGKTWIAEPVSSGGSSTQADASFSGDVVNALTTLDKQGITVQQLGTKVIGNVNCTGYSVTPPSSAGETGTITVWIDSQHLVREFSMNVAPDVMLNGVAIGASSTGGASGSLPLSMNIQMDFSYSALPLHVEAPPASSTISLDEYLGQLGQAAKTSTS